MTNIQNNPDETVDAKKPTLQIAVPVAEGRLCPHFGHCEQFAIAEVDPQAQAVRHIRFLTPPAHQPGVLPEWLRRQGVSVVIAGGMGQRAIHLLREAGVEVVVGAGFEPPERVIERYLAGDLESGGNLCDH
ncbi:MAG: NifB/NifX family molybdenum-iron cluster-binding protein [Verrucomicrobia bacterium]|nr:NifB/NifX family molybdenum-iron cluster-binding protein [Verrucomicrobiota bacterium]